MLRSQEAAAASGERKHWEWHGDGNINSDLTYVDFVHELSRCGAVRRENRGSVSVRIIVDDWYGVVETFRWQADQHRAENFLFVATHGWCDFSQNGWANKVALLILLHGDFTAVQHNFCAFVCAWLNQTQNAFLRLRGDNGSNIDARLMTSSNFELRRAFHKVGNPLASIANKDGSWLGRRRVRKATRPNGTRVQIPDLQEPCNVDPQLRKQPRWAG